MPISMNCMKIAKKNQRVKREKGKNIQLVGGKEKEYDLYLLHEGRELMEREMQERKG